MFTPDQKLAQHRKDRGFTLIELLVTVTIAGILAAIAIPAFKSFVAQQRIKTASFDIMSALTMARSEAIKRNTNTGVTINPVGGNWQNGWTITFVDPVTGQTNTLSNQAALGELTVTCLPACQAITYNRNGRIAGAASPSIQLGSTATTDVRCVSADLSGRPNSKKASCP